MSRFSEFSNTLANLSRADFAIESKQPAINLLLSVEKKLDSVNSIKIILM